MAKLTTQTRLRKQLKKISQPHSGWINVFPAIMGKADGTVLTGIPGLVWIHDLRNGQDVMVYNYTTGNTPLLQVEVGRRVDQPGLWQIKGTVEPFSVPSTSGGSGSGSVVGEHHHDHEFPNSGTVWVDRKQIKHLTVLVSDASNFIVKLLGGIVLTANGITKIPTQTVDLSSYVPTTGAVFVSIESDDDGVITVNAGTGFGSPFIATVDDIPSPAAGQYTRAYVLLYEGQSALSNNDIVVPMPPDFNPVAFSGSSHDHDSRYPRKWTGKTAAPGVDDDSDAGYAVDDIWVDETNDKAYIAVDVTVGAAVWVEMGGGFDLAAAIHGAAASAITDDDEMGFWESVADGLKKITWANIKATLKTYFDTLYSVLGHTHTADTEEVQDIVGAMFSGNTETGIAATYDDTGGKVNLVAEVTQTEFDDTIDALFAFFAPISKGVTNGDSHDHNGGDGAQINHTTLSNIGTNTHAQIDTHIASTSNPHSVTAAQAVAIPQDGWIAGTGTWSYTSADAPSFVASVPDADAALMQVGYRIKLTQTSAKYFIVTAKGSPSGGFTPVTIYGGTDYTLANAAISSPYFSPVKGPFGFPLDPSKWSVTTTDTSDRTQSTPTTNTWYNPGSLSISIPIGCWNVSYKVLQRVARAAATLTNMYSTLSTANNSESDADFTTLETIGGASGSLVLLTTQHCLPKVLSLAAKTSYFLNCRTTSGADSIGHRGDSGTTIIRALCAYL